MRFLRSGPRHHSFSPSLSLARARFGSVAGTVRRIPFARLVAAVLIGCATTWSCVFGQQVEPSPSPESKKLIEWGWDEPDTRFLRTHIEQMERMPFDGLVFHVNSSRGGNFTWEMWGGRRFERAEFDEAVADLQNTRFQRFTELFLRVNVTPGKVDWFDDRAWQEVLQNVGVAAQVAKEGRCRGFMFDVEQYEHPLFQVPEGSERSFEQYQAQVRQRGREWMQEVNRHFPDITVLLTFGYALAQPREGTSRVEARYGLLASFLDGMLEACSDETQLVDAWEFSYPYKRPEQFQQAYATITRQSLEWTSVPDRYGHHMRAGFGIWMDYDWRRKGWDTENLAANHFNPDEFEQAVRAALATSDRYVWIYTEQPRWWTDEKLPAAYIEALERARQPDPAGPTSARE